MRIYNRALTASEAEFLGDLNSGLQGYWRFDENTGTTTTDASGRGHTGTLTSGAAWWGGGEVGAAASFDGVNDYVSMGTSPLLVMTSAASFTAWIYPTGGGSNALNGGTIVSREGELPLTGLPTALFSGNFPTAIPVGSSLIPATWRHLISGRI